MQSERKGVRDTGVRWQALAKRLFPGNPVALGVSKVTLANRHGSAPP